MNPSHTHVRLYLLLALAGALLLAGVAIQSVRADIGPKPSMTFHFVYEIEPVEILGGQQIECNDPQCADSRVLEEGGPQRFYCPTAEPDMCYSVAYGYHPYHKLVIEFADGRRESNVFEERAFNSTLRVRVLESSLQVESTAPIAVNNPLLSVMVTLVVETVVAAIYLVVFKLPIRLLIWVPVANFLTLPLVWLAFPLLPLPAAVIMALYEVFAIGFEAGLLYLASRGRLPLKHAIILSFVMNLASLAVGLLIS